MKNIFLFITLFISNIALAQKRDYSIQSVSFTKVNLQINSGCQELKLTGW